MVLQCMQETQDRNNNNQGEGSGNSVGEALIANPYYQGLSEFRKATPPSFHGDYNPILAHAARENLYGYGIYVYKRWFLPPIC